LGVAHRKSPCISLRRDIPFAPTGRPHTSPGGNPGKSHPGRASRPVGTPNIMERRRATRRYAAFLQNAFMSLVPYPERCSGLVCEAPLGHGPVNAVFAMERIVGFRCLGGSCQIQRCHQAPPCLACQNHFNPWAADGCA
jgi:hypothetical protein